VQSALLEAMQERQVTIGEQSFPLDPLFLVMATQNPIEQEGTYPLPEAQVDRFMLKVKIGYPKPEEERKVVDLALDRTTALVKAVATPADIVSMVVDLALDRATALVKAVATPADIVAMRDVVELIYLDDKVKDYALSIVQATRDPAKFGLKDVKPLIAFGASPRASIYLAVGARALAFLEGRGYVTPQEVKDIAHDVLRHRVLLSYEAEAEEIDSDAVIAKILAAVPVP
jgi:MoxR-like ATPase